MSEKKRTGWNPHKVLHKNPWPRKDWWKIPLKLRQEWWAATDYSRNPEKASPELVKTINDAIRIINDGQESKTDKAT